MLAMAFIAIPADLANAIFSIGFGYTRRLAGRICGQVAGQRSQAAGVGLDRVFRDILLIL